MAGKRFLGICQPGDRVRGYTVERRLDTGRKAVSFAARDAGGKAVFLKQYKSPSVRVKWYKAYVDYQAEIKRRIETTVCKNFFYRFIEFFEEERYYFQVFEFLDLGQSLEKTLDQLARTPGAVTPAQRLIMAKVLMSGISNLHTQAKIVHSDLKPSNLMLQEDRSILAGYRLKIIDIDCSLLADRQAPWHGQADEGYFGTVGYMSPEHYRGQVPGPASDVFTCGLMLYELLADGHPLRSDDEDQIRAATLAGSASPPTLIAGLGLPNADAVAAVMHRCLALEPSARPTAEDVVRVLNNQPVEPAPAPLPPPVPVPPSAPAPPPPEPAPVRPLSRRPRRLVLTSAAGETLDLGVGMTVGRGTYGRCFKSEDRKYLGEAQYDVVSADGEWYVEPHPAAAVQTLVNGKRVTARQALRPGDVLTFGREATPEKRGLELIPLTVSFAEA